MCPTAAVNRAALGGQYSKALIRLRVICLIDFVADLLAAYCSFKFIPVIRYMFSVLKLFSYDCGSKDHFLQKRIPRNLKLEKG